MKYQGKNNTECPRCKGNISNPHAMTFRVDEVVKLEHLWCERCFDQVYKRYVTTLLDASKHLLTANEIQKEVSKVFTPPNDYKIVGFWFATYEDGKIGFQLNYQHQRKE